MKVIAFNGSPRKEGNTYTLLKTVCTELESKGIETEIIHVGNRNIHGCIACNKCKENGDMRCVFNDDIINEAVKKIQEADAVLLGSPVYFATLSAQMKAFIDRVGMLCRPHHILKRKVCAAVVAGRRNGFINAFNTMNNLFTISEAIVVGSSYWNQAIGEDVKNDTEGLETMKNLGENMAWLLYKLQD